MRRVPVAALFLSILIVSSPPALAEWPSLGPLLDAPLLYLDQDESSSLRAQLPAEEPLVVVLWNTECPDCLENVRQAAALAAKPGGPLLLGVVHERSPWDAHWFAEEQAASFPHLHDPLGTIAGKLGAASSSFSFALLAPDGRLLAFHRGSVPDAGVTIRDALAALAAHKALEPPTAAAALRGEIVAISKAAGRIRSEGRLRVKSLAVGLEESQHTSPCAGASQACACENAGAYGEALRPLADLLFRLELDTEIAIGAGLDAGVRLRLSNEAIELLEQGPQYLSSQYGSAFLAYRAARWEARLGYFETHFTPFTLQRWDFADNPPVAGSGGAGSCSVCGGSARALSLEALDDLGPDLTVEGLQLSAAPTRWLALEAFAARLRRALPFSPSSDPFLRYRQDLVGLRLALRAGLGGKEPAELGLQYVAAGEDGGSVEVPSWFQDASTLIHRGEVAALALTAPLPRSLRLEAELARSVSRIDSVDARGRSRRGWAHRVGLAFAPKHGPQLSLAWIDLDTGFHAEYAALSYLPGLRGWRGSLDWRGEHAGLSLFAKRLLRKGGYPGEGESLAKTISRSALISVFPRVGASVDLAYTLGEDEIEQVFAGGAPPEDCACRQECEKQNWTLALRQEIGQNAALNLELSRIRTDGRDHGGSSTAELLSLMVTADF